MPYLEIVLALLVLSFQLGHSDDDSGMCMAKEPCSEAPQQETKVDLYKASMFNYR